MEIQERVARLVDAWCERRALRALREILSAWPLSGGLTDEWADLVEALKAVRAFASNELTEAEADVVEKLIAAAERVAFR